MPTMRQLQREIGQRLVDLGYSIYPLEDRASVLHQGDQIANNAPAEIQEQFERWCALEGKRFENQRPATPAEMDAIDARLAECSHGKLDEEEREVLAGGGRQSDELLDELQARMNVFTDDISAAMSGEDPNRAFDGQEHKRYAFPPSFKPWPLNDTSPLAGEEEAAPEGMKP